MSALPAQNEPALATETDLRMDKGLPAMEVDRRLVSLSRTERRIESVLCFYLKEVDERRLYLDYGHASTVDYSRERLGFEDRKTRSLLRMAYKFEDLPRMKEAFHKGELPWTKAREAIKVAKPETEEMWIDKCRSLTNRQLEEEVRKTLPPVRKKTFVFVLEGDRLDTWENAREACEQQAGKTLTDMEAFDLMCAEVLCTYALTPPFGDGDSADGGFARNVAERDRWQCVRPGCSNRSALQSHHIMSRGRGGPDTDWNQITVCAACHLAITQGRLKVSGRAPDRLKWEGPFGVIENPLPLSSRSSEVPQDHVTVQVPDQRLGASADHVINAAAPGKRPGHFPDHVISAALAIRKGQLADPVIRADSG